MGASLRLRHPAVNSERSPRLAAKCRCQLNFRPSSRSTFSQRIPAVKPAIHPNYQRATVQCACGNSFITRSTTPAIHVEVCAKCHPYFTGKLRLMDTAGRVERFRQKYAADKTSEKTPG